MAHDGPDSSGEDDRARELASTWVQAVAATTYVPMSMRELREYLYELVRTMADALVAQPFSPKPGVEVGHRMVAGQLVGLDSLRRSIALLVDGLLDLTGPPDAERVGNVAALLGAVSAGYAEAMRTRILEQQEDMKRALLGAKQRAEKVMRATENLFREVFAASPTGIAITDLAALRTTAVRDADGYVVNGQKIFTTGAHDADHIWLACRTDREAPRHKGISILIVDTSDPGFAWTPIITCDGAHHVNATYYTDVRVPLGK